MTRDENVASAAAYDISDRILWLISSVERSEKVAKMKKGAAAAPPTCTPVKVLPVINTAVSRRRTDAAAVEDEDDETLAISKVPKDESSVSMIELSTVSSPPKAQRIALPLLFRTEKIDSEISNVCVAP